MNDSEFNKLTIKELVEACRICVKNSQRHYKAAMVLDKQGLFGIANSHLILSSEEAIKAFIFFSKNLYRNEFIEVGDVFSDHSLKHNLAKEGYEILQHFIPALRNVFITIIQNIHMFIGKDDETIVKTTTQLAKQYLNDLVSSFDPMKLRKDKKWWGKANKKKNQGFYVDYKNKQWKTPADITKEDFVESHKIVNKFVIAIMVLSELEEDDYNMIAKNYEKEKAENRVSV